MPSAFPGLVKAIDFGAINADIIPAIDNAFDLGRADRRFRSCRIGQDLTLGGNLAVAGDLTVEGTTTTINSTILSVDDKNIELASTPSPTDALADGGGLILKGTTDITMLWGLATNSWNFNRAIQTGNLRLDGNVFSSIDTNGTIIVAPDGTGALLLNTNRVLILGSSPAATGDNSELVEMRDDRVTTGSVPNYVLSINSQNSSTTALYLGNDGNGDPVVAMNNRNLRIGNDISGTFTERMRVEPGGKVGVGEPGPDTKLHVTDGGSAGVVTAFAGTVATFESPGNGFLSILTPDASVRGILFGEPSSNIAGGIFYNDPGSLDGFQFRVNGNVTKMVIEPDGIGMGTTNPDFTALLELKSTTHGFLPPRMTTIQIDAIASPAIGLEGYDTTINKKKVFTGAEFKTFLTEDIGQVLIQETFDSSNVRFFGELALPAAQGWTDTATGSATIVLATATVFGEVRQVVRHFDDSTNGATTSSIALTAQNWIDINAFGASYGGTSRLNTALGGNGFFSGLQANAAENPLVTGNRRYGIFFNNNAGNLQLGFPDVGGGDVTLDGTGGNPLVTFDEFFRWECVVPAGLGVAEFYVNGILTTFAPAFNTNTGGLGTSIQVGSGSTAGANRLVDHDNFGVTIYEEAATKTLAAVTMVGDVAQVNIPEGKRDYVIILPDGNPRSIGAVLRLVVSNLGGSVSLQNENPAVPEILYNGLRTLAINVAVKETIEGINTISSGNVYLGFQTDQTTSHLDEFDANDATFPATAPAVANSRNAHPILVFDDGVVVAEESVVFHNVMSRDYSGGNILVDIDWVAATATSGRVTWGVEFERVIPGGQDIDSDGFAAQKTATGTTNGTSGIVTRTTITLTQAEADAIAAGDSHRLRLERVTTDGGDTMIGDAQVLSVIVRQ